MKNRYILEYTSFEGSTQVFLELTSNEYEALLIKIEEFNVSNRYGSYILLTVEDWLDRQEKEIPSELQ